MRVSDDEKRLAKQGLPTRELEAVERLVYDSLPLDKTDRKSLGKLRTELDARAAEDEARLLRDGLILDDARAKAVGRMAFAPYVLVLFGLGCTRLALGLAEGKPVVFLVVLLVAALAVGVWVLTRRLRRTHKGEAVLKQLQDRRSDLQRAEQGRHDPGLAVALFGTAALVGAEYAALQRWYPKPTSGSGCGSGCSAGGCGGGSGCGGDGCGGCGGD